MTRTLAVVFAVICLSAVGAAWGAAPPGPPSNLVIADVPSDQGTALHIAFTKSPDDGAGAADVKYYDILRSRTGTAYGRIDRLTAKGINTYAVKDASVSAGVLYYYRVLAWDGTQYSSPLDGQGTPVDNLPPAPPASLNIADHPGDQGTALDLQIGKSPDDGAGVGDVRQYLVFRRQGASAYEQVAQVKATGAASYGITDPGLTPGASYSYKVYALDGRNRSDPVSGAGVPIDNVKPAPPAYVHVTDHPDDQGTALDVVIGKSSDDGAGAKDVTQYLVFRRQGTSGYAPLSPVAATGAASYQFTDPGLKPGAKYTYKVCASDGTNQSNPVTGSGVPIDDLAPGPPSAVTVTDVPGDSGGAVKVSFQASPDDGQGADDVVSYDVMRQKAGESAEPFKTIAATHQPSYQFTDSTVVASVAYTYRVRAFDGHNFSAVALGSGHAVDNTPPAPPTGFKVVPAIGLIGGAAITFNASVDDVPTHPKVTRYEIFRKQGNGPWSATPTITLAAKQAAAYAAQDKGLTVGKNYSYRARAVAAGGNSLFTDAATLTAIDGRQPRPPGTLTAWDRPDDYGKAVYVRFLRSADDGAGLKIAQKYIVYRKLTSVFQTDTVKVATITANGAPAYQILDTGSDLTDLRSYTYWAVAYSASGVASDDSNTADAVPQDNVILAPPTNLAAQDHTGDSGVIQLSWTRSTSEGGIGPPPPPPFSIAKAPGDKPQDSVNGTYEVFRRKLGTDWPATPSFTVSTSVTGNPIVTLNYGLTNGVTYQYEVRFRVDTVISPFSNVAQTAPSAKVVTSTSATAGGLAVAIAAAPTSAAAGSAVVVQVRVEGSGASRVRLMWAAGAGAWQATAEMSGSGSYDANFTLVPGAAKAGDPLHLVAVASDGTREVRSHEVVISITP